MNPRQMALQIRHELRSVTWDGGSGEVVFGQRGVHVYAGSSPTEEQLPPGFPFALVSIDNGTADPDHPELLEQGFTVVVVAEVTGDTMGELAIVGGGNVGGDRGRSANRGSEELVERARFAVQDLTGYDGARILLTGTATGSPVSLGRGKHLAMSDVSLSALCTSQPHYSAPQEIGYTGSGSVLIAWNGAPCASRFDFLQYRLVEKAGTSPSTDPSDGTVIYTGTTPSTTQTLVAGRYYTVFADYDSHGYGTVEGSSSPEVGTYFNA